MTPGGRRALALAATLLAAACTRGTDPLADCRLPPDATVLAIGDSLTRGHGAVGQGYAEQLQAMLAATPGRAGVRVVNLGIDGERSDGLLARIDDALAAHRPSVVLMTSGGNDLLRRVAAADVRAHLRAVVDRVRGAGAAAVVFAVPAPSLGAVLGVASDHELFDDLAADARALVVPDVVARTLADESLRADRIHPNAAGYAGLAQAAAEALRRCR